jgi:hypothetical protein
MRAALDEPGLLNFMRFTSALASAGPIAQGSDLVRRLLDECTDFFQQVGRSIDAAVERQRAIKAMELMPLRVLRTWHDHVAGVVDHIIDRRPAVSARPREMVAQMPKELEWELATQGARALGEKVDLTAKLHQTAEIEINAAIYALDGLFDDLSGIMSIRARRNVFAHQADYTEENADSLYAAAVRVAVDQIATPPLAARHAA